MEKINALPLVLFNVFTFILISGRTSSKTRRSSIAINPSENLKCNGMLTDEGCTCMSESHHRVRILRHH